MMPLQAHHHQQAKGFTLLEVMVALAVVAISLFALIKVSEQYAGNAGYLKQKTLAQWIAENKATEYRLKKEFPALGRQQGDVTMVNQQWRWQVKVSNTDDKRLRRLDIEVVHETGDFDNPLASLIAFVGQPQ